MSSTTFFDIFLLVDVFIMGGLAVLALQHARAHYQTPTPQAEKLSPPLPKVELSAADKQRILKASQDKFQAVLNNSATLLQADLGTTAGEINNMVNHLAVEIVSEELERYRAELAKLHTQAVGDIGGVKKELDGHQAEIRAKMDQELQAEKLRLVKQIDTKLADAVGSFLVETLQHNVDLGSQTPYLIALLEEHKADFKKEVADETQSAK